MLHCILKTSAHLPALDGNEIRHEFDCKLGIVLSNSVLNMCIVNPPVYLHTLRAYSWHAHNAMACRSRCMFLFSIGDRRVSDHSLLNHTITV